MLGILPSPAHRRVGVGSPGCSLIAVQGGLGDPLVRVRARGRVCGACEHRVCVVVAAVRARRAVGGVLRHGYS